MVARLPKVMLNIKIKTIPHDEHPYPTVGNYWDGHSGARIITVSDMANEDYEFLVGLHELIESTLCRKRGITDKKIVEFDKKFEKERRQGLHKIEDEPGCDSKAPYRKEHMLATRIEQILARELGVDWDAYAKVVMSL